MIKIFHVMHDALSERGTSPSLDAVLFVSMFTYSLEICYDWLSVTSYGTACFLYNTEFEIWKRVI